MIDSRTTDSVAFGNRWRWPLWSSGRGVLPASADESGRPAVSPSAGSIAAPTCRSTGPSTMSIALIERAARSGYTAIMLADYKLQILDRVIDSLLSQCRACQGGRGEGRHRADPGRLLDRLQQRASWPTTPTSPRACRSIDPPFVVRRSARPVLVAACPELPGRPQRRPRGDQRRSVRRLLASRTTRQVTRSPTARSSTAARSPAASSRDQGHGRRRRTPPDPDGQGPPARLLPVLLLGRRPATSAPPGRFSLLALGPSEPGAQLTFHEGGLEPTRTGSGSRSSSTASTRTKSNLYAGFWGEGRARSGSTTWRSRSWRWSTSCGARAARSTVTSADGKTTYEEGRDFEPVARPEARARSPTPGEYDFEPRRRRRIRLTPGSRIKDGEPAAA